MKSEEVRSAASGTDFMCVVFLTYSLFTIHFSLIFLLLLGFVEVIVKSEEVRSAASGTDFMCGVSLLIPYSLFPILYSVRGC